MKTFSSKVKWTPNPLSSLKWRLCKYRSLSADLPRLLHHLPIRNQILAIIWQPRHRPLVWCNWRGYTLGWPRHENIPEPDENDEMPGDVRKGSECLNNVSGVPCPPGPSHFPVTGDWNADCCATGRITDMTVTIIPTLPSWRTMTWWSKDIGDIRQPDIRTGVSQPREEQTVTFL